MLCYAEHSTHACAHAQENIKDLFKKYNVPREFDMLSIDVDVRCCACCVRPVRAGFRVPSPR